ncbi:MAG: Fe-S cluster assembly protein SufD [Chryseolinea sp.]
MVKEKNIEAVILNTIDSSVGLFPHVQELRQEAREAFVKLGLPDNKSEEYKHTPITRLLNKNFSFEGESPVGEPGEIGIAGVDAYLMVYINGKYSAQHSNIEGDGIEIGNLSEAVAKGDETVLAHLGKYVSFQADGFAAWNTAAWDNGAYIRVRENTILSRPVLIHHVNDASNGEVITVNRNLFVVGRSSEVTIIEKYDSRGKSNHFSNHVTEAFVDENASLNHYTIQHDPGNRYLNASTGIQQSRSSRVNTFTFTLSGKLIRNTLHLALDGEGIESHMFGLYLISGDTIADNHTVVDHRKPNSYSNEIYKGVMDGHSKGVFNGKIYVRPHAQKTNAFQANRNILLSDSSTVNTKPQLEIWADDVKCSHGCTTGQLDEEAMFYLQTRGIDKETSRAMMLYAFASEILNNVRHPELKTYFDRLISERLHKTFD